MKTFAAALLLTVSLSACGSEKESKQQGGQSQGEILPASVSDDMIALDQVKSQSPLAPKGDGSGTDKKKSGPSAEKSAAAKEE